MRLTAASLIAITAAITLTGCANNTVQDEKVDADAPGLRVGDQVPDVTLQDAEGNPVTLASLYADNPVIVTFYRGGWCPFCNRALKDWATRIDEVRDAGAEFVAITPEKPDAFTRTVDKNDLNYTVLGDPDLNAAKAFNVHFTLSDDEKANLTNYGIDVAANNSSNTWELPAPGTFLIDTTGVVRYAFADWDYKQRADPDDVIAALESLN